MKIVIVTDPCYLILNKDWDKLCNEYLTGGDKQYTNFASAVESFLRDISGDKFAVAGDTGFGDWSNEIDEQAFYADSGMVCVVEETEKLKEYLGGFKFGLGARLTVNQSATYEIDQSNPDWSIVRVNDVDKVYESLK